MVDDRSGVVISKRLEPPGLILFGILDVVDVLAVLFVYLRLKGPPDLVTDVPVLWAMSDAVMTALDVVSKVEAFFGSWLAEVLSKQHFCQ